MHCRRWSIFLRRKERHAAFSTRLAKFSSSLKPGRAPSVVARSLVQKSRKRSKGLESARMGHHQLCIWSVPEPRTTSAEPALLYYASAGDARCGQFLARLCLRISKNFTSQGNDISGFHFPARETVLKVWHFCKERSNGTRKFSIWSSPATSAEPWQNCALRI